MSDAQIDERVAASATPDSTRRFNHMNNPRPIIEHLPVAGAERSIGAILIDAGKLKPADAERVLRLQRDKGMRFGDAAKQLGLITDADIEQALSRQFDYPYLARGDSHVAEEVVAAYKPFAPQVEALRALRSQLILRWFDADAGRKSLAVTSPGRGEARSWLTANLGVVFSQLGERTLVMDAALRSPRQHALFGIENRVGLSAALSGRGNPDIIQRVPALRDLSVLPAGACRPAAPPHRGFRHHPHRHPRREPIRRRPDHRRARRRRPTGRPTQRHPPRTATQLCGYAQTGGCGRGGVVAERAVRRRRLPLFMSQCRRAKPVKTPLSRDATTS